MSYFKETRPLEVKEINSAGEFTGILSIFDEIDAYNDTVKRGAYKKTLRERKRFLLLWSHDVTEPIGSFTGYEGDEGLVIDGKINQDVQRGREARSLILNDGLDGLSIGFDAVKWSMEERDGVSVRVLKEIRLWEGSIVAFPADQHARIMQAKAASILRRPEELTDDDLREWLCCLPDEQRSRIESLLKSEPELPSTRGSEQPMLQVIEKMTERLRALKT